MPTRFRDHGRTLYKWSSDGNMANRAAGGASVTDHGAIRPGGKRVGRFSDLLRAVLSWRAPPALGAAGIGVLLGMWFATLSGEVIDPAAPSYASSAFLVVMTTGWGAVGGIAFSRRTGFPPPSAPAADWVWQGGIRGAIAAALALAIWLLSWLLLDLDGPKPRLGGDLWELLGAAWGYTLVGFFLGAAFAAAVWWRSSDSARRGDPRT